MNIAGKNYKGLAQWSITFIILIFISQAFLITRLFLVNYGFLEKLVNTVSQEVYTTDLNRRLRQVSPNSKPRMEIEDVNTKSTGKSIDYVLDGMPGVNNSNAVTLINIGMELYMDRVNPIELTAIDSAAYVLLAQEKIHANVLSQVIDVKAGKVLKQSKPAVHISKKRFSTIRSKTIPLNFEQTKVLQLVILNPLYAVFSQMAGLLLLSFLLCLFCICCLYILQRTVARQKQLAQSKSDFYNQVSHEMKRPVSVIYQAVDSLMNTRAIDDVGRRKNYLAISKAELDRMSSKIDMILAISMEEEGMFRLNCTEFNLPDMMSELIERFQVVAQKPVEFMLDSTLTSPLIVADKDHLFQCFSNLLENAIKYSGDKVQIAIRLFLEQRNVCVAVRDDGIGISPNDQERIFEKFERAKIDKKVYGYGIGLSYVKQIIEKHGGSVSVFSEEGNGSEFIVRLPVSRL